VPLNDPIWAALAATGAAVWLAILLQPWQPWRIREVLDADEALAHGTADLSDITVLIPARNEADVIRGTIDALANQGSGLRVIVVDDQSDDGTADAARRASDAADGLTLDVITGAPLPDGWAGKMWALEQARNHATTPLVLLLDADIELAPGLLATLKMRRLKTGARFISLMANLRMVGIWEKLLMPAFVFFFKLLYPFQLSNNQNKWVAAGAGGCVLTDSALLAEMGGFGAIRNAIIDDCALAGEARRANVQTWIGLTHSVCSTRPYGGLASIWNMVARSAFTQLRYSLPLLLLCTLVLVIACWLPVIAIFVSPALVPKMIGAGAFVGMMAAYGPTLGYYRRGPLWAATMPLIGTLYLAMTWGSAWRYWRGARSQWKGRTYSRRQ